MESVRCGNILITFENKPGSKKKVYASGVVENGMPLKRSMSQ